MAGDHEFQSRLGRRYTDFENELDAQDPDDTRQLWHTPTELFRPYYGEAIARYLVTNYKSCCSPYHDLIIYEMGAGNGTLMLNILDYIREFHPDIYNRTKYKVIEISSSMASIQSSQLTQSSSSHGHASHVEIINRSIFAWDNYVAAPCYFLALEVIDNFAHDAIRYDPFTEEPLQANVLVDNYGEFYEFYTKEVDPVAARFLRIRDAACSRPFEHPLKYPRFIRNFKSRLPFAGNLTVPEYIPTRLMEFFDILRNFFPLHRLLTSDFHYLPDTIKGINAPVVQTRYQRQVVPVKTLFVSIPVPPHPPFLRFKNSSLFYLYLPCKTIIPANLCSQLTDPPHPQVKQGYFDILFPTDFSVMEDMYRAITGNVSRVLSHEDFLQHWACVEDTQTRNGENPLLSWYANASVMMTA